ncbi:MAG: ATP-binding protein [Candidatus Krumholzibacteriia bacterium]
MFPSATRAAIARGRAAATIAMVVCCLPLVLGGCREADLRWLPYDLHKVNFFDLKDAPEPTPGPSCVWGDVDGDGLAEMFHHYDFCLLGRSHEWPLPPVIWQHPFLPPFHTHRPVAQLCLDFDLDGDGRPELVATAADSLNLRWLTRVLDPRTGDTRAAFETPMHDGRFADGRWDGSLTPLGGVSGGREGGQVLVLVGRAGYDVTGRGVRAVDPWSGEDVWRVELGPCPNAAASRLADLDQDGRREIILSCGGVDNLRQERIGTASDDSSYVMVFDDQGRLRWQWAVAAHPSGAVLAVADVDGDGVLDVVCGGGSQAGGSGILAALDGATGRPLGVAATDLDVTSLVLWSTGTDGDLRLAVSQRGGLLTTWNLAPSGRFSERGRVWMPANAALRGRADLLAGRPPFILAELNNVGVVVLSDDLAPQAFLPKGRPRTADALAVWQLDAGPPLLFSSEHARQAFVMRRARWPWLVGAGASLAAVPLTTLAVRRRRRRPVSAAVQRELALGLLDRLRTIRHETFGTLECFDRLAWHCRAAVEMSDGPTVPGQEIRDLAADARASALQRLDEVVDLARQVRVRDHRLASLAETCAGADRLLGRLEADEPVDLEAMVAELEALQQALQVEVARVRDEVESRFVADLPGVLAGVLRSQASALAGAEVKVTVQGRAGTPDAPAATAACAVICDPDDLAFCLDNLVGNAVRAMRGSVDRELGIAWTTDELRTVVTVVDTGCGIPPADWAQILAGKGSTRRGGGFGFARTQETLRRFRGELDIAASRPGRGTTFELTLRTARAPVHPGRAA